MPHTYTKSEVYRATNLAKQLKMFDEANNVLLEELYALVGTGSFGANMALNPNLTARRVGEARRLMYWGDNSLKSYFDFAVWEYEKVRPGFKREMHDVANQEDGFQELTLEEQKRVREIAVQHDLNEVEMYKIGRKITKITDPKMTTVDNALFANEMLEGSEFRLHAVAVYSHLNHTPDAVIKPFTPKPLVEGEIGVKDVPSGTLLRKKCGCVYKKCYDRRDPIQTKLHWIRTRGSSSIMLVEPAQECRTMIHRRKGDKIGSHGAQVGETTVSWSKEFALVNATIKNSIDND